MSRELKLTHDEAITILGLHDDLPTSSILKLMVSLIEGLQELTPCDNPEIQSNIAKVILSGSKKADEIHRIITSKAFN